MSATIANQPSTNKNPPMKSATNPPIVPAPVTATTPAAPVKSWASLAKPQQQQQQTTTTTAATTSNTSSNTTTTTSSTNTQPTNTNNNNSAKTTNLQKTNQSPNPSNGQPSQQQQPQNKSTNGKQQSHPPNHINSQQIPPSSTNPSTTPSSSSSSVCPHPDKKKPKNKGANRAQTAEGHGEVAVNTSTATPTSNHLLESNQLPPQGPPALNTINSSSHSTPSSAISTPTPVTDLSHPGFHSTIGDGPSAFPSTNVHSGHSAPFSQMSSSGSNPSSVTNSPSGRKKAHKKSQQQHPQQQQPHPHGLQPHHQQQQLPPQQQQQQPFMNQPYPHYPQPNMLQPNMYQPPGGLRAPFPSPAPSGSPMQPDFLNPTLPMMSFPMFAGQPIPQQYQPQPQQHHGKKHQQHQPNYQQQYPNNPNYPPMQFYPGGVAVTGGSAGTTPLATTPPTLGPASAGALRGQPYSGYFQQAPPQPFLTGPINPLAFQMNSLALAAAPGGVNQFLPAVAAQLQSGIVPREIYSVPAPNATTTTTATSSTSSQATTPTPIPQFPAPFATSPFAELIATGNLTHSSSPYYSIDIESVASGPGHNDRAMAHIAVVDQHHQVILNMYVKPKKPVVSYLPALTGLSEKDLVNGMSEEEALDMFRRTIPSNAVLVGQNILKDVEWLQLVEGQDFASMLDLAGLYATKNPTYKTLTFFSLSHVAKALLCLDQQEQHHPAIDAWLSIQLYQLYQLLQANPDEFERAKKLLLAMPVEPAFNKKNPVYEGVCMGNKKECKCGSPWFF